jgi:predicted acyltransferase (DUF342 family)
MSGLIAASVLVLVFFLLLAVPLTPACLELIYKSDGAPLKVVQQHAGDVRFFADGFRNYLSRIQKNIDECELFGSDALVVMPDGIPCLVIAQRNVQHDFGIDANRVCSKVIAAVETLQLPPDTIFEQDIYSRRRIHGGKGTRYRAILGERDVHLAESTVVMRWVHAVGDIECAPSCDIYGRISSEMSIQLQRGCRFTRVNAPRIEIGSQERREIQDPFEVRNPRAGGEPRERVLWDGNFEIAPGAVFDKNLVVRGELRIGAGARVLGDVKAQRLAVLENGVVACGSLISSGDLRIGGNCRVQGPVIAERTLAIESGTYVGTPESHTTAAAPKIEIAEGVIVFGTLWAREQGIVVSQG